jgi:hypothetical protein
MKNYVVWTNCKVNETQSQFDIAPCGDPASQQAYNTMFQISRATAKKFLAGEWQEIVFDEPAESRVHMFQRNWQRIWDLWHKEPCNILYLDSDTMIVKPTEIFDQFNEFRMFNWTDPKSNQQFPNYYNAGVRYYPSTIKPEIWKIGEDLAKNWRLDIWDQEQLIFNAMFWAQNVSDAHHPRLNWQGMRMIQPQSRQKHEQWNQCAVEDAHIMHVHGSRNATQTAKLMVNTVQQLGIKI